MKSWRLPLDQKTHMNMHYFIHQAKTGYPIFHPSLVEFVASPARGTHDPNTTPFAYLTDALTGLSGAKLILHAEENFKNFSHPPGVIKAWQQLEVSLEIYRRSHLRIKEYTKNSSKLSPETQVLIQGTQSIIAEGTKNNTLSIKAFEELIGIINQFEQKLTSPLVYNFNVNLPGEAIEVLLTLYSFLFNLRALIALDYNSQTKDSTFEALRVDSVSDYLADASFVANDTILYHSMMNLTKKHKVPPEFTKSMQERFQAWTHNGTTLYHSLPESIFKTNDPEELIETLYNLQMDWLLGSPSGVLFRLREELYASKEGFHRIFWPEAGPRPSNRNGKLEVACDLGSGEIAGFKKSAA